jgi:lycopene cyclase domain-containing protein
MTYSGFLLVFLGTPILILAGAAWLDNRRGRQLPRSLTGWNPWAAIALHVVIAVVYTTPWDNYLVANGVWYYNPALVTGLVLGWVPIEEYAFFVLQTVLAGLWMLFLAKRLQFQQPPNPLRPAWRWAPAAVLGVLWVFSVGILVTGRISGTYLGLELTWALPPIILQVAFGGDILRRYARLVLGSLLPLVIYLSIADSLAIISGTWTINPEQSLNIFIGSLPLEEIIFFLLTSTLVIFGITLLLSLEGQGRLDEIRRSLGKRRKSSSELMSSRLR